MSMYSKPVISHEFDKYDEPRLHMEALLSTHLINFDISIRILITLETAGITTLGHLTSKTKTSLTAIRNLGNLSINRLEQLLHNLKLDFADK